MTTLAFIAAFLLVGFGGYCMGVEREHERARRQAIVDAQRAEARREEQDEKENERRHARAERRVEQAGKRLQLAYGRADARSAEAMKSLRVLYPDRKIGTPLDRDDLVLMNLINEVNGAFDDRIKAEKTYDDEVEAAWKLANELVSAYGAKVSAASVA